MSLAIYDNTAVMIGRRSETWFLKSYFRNARTIKPFLLDWRIKIEVFLELNNWNRNCTLRRIGKSLSMKRIYTMHSLQLLPLEWNDIHTLVTYFPRVGYLSAWLDGLMDWRSPDHNVSTNVPLQAQFILVCELLYYEDSLQVVRITIAKQFF